MARTKTPVVGIEEVFVPSALLLSKKAAADARREEMRTRGSINVLPTVYYAPTLPQTDALLLALDGDGDFSNDIAQEATSGNVVFVYSKRTNLVVGEQITTYRYGFNAGAGAVVLTVTGTAVPAGFDMSEIKIHDIVAVDKANDKRKAAAKAERVRVNAFAAIGF